MKRISLPLTTAVLLAALLIGTQGALAGKAWTKGLPLPLQRNGKPYPSIWCGGCSKYACTHALTKWRKMERFFRYRAPAYKLSWNKIRGTLPKTGLQVLGRGWTITQWKFYIEWKYSDCKCGCLFKQYGRCEGRYPWFGHATLKTTRPVTSKDFAPPKVAPPPIPKPPPVGVDVGLAGFWAVSPKDTKYHMKDCKCCKLSPKGAAVVSRFGVGGVEGWVVKDSRGRTWFFPYPDSDTPHRKPYRVRVRKDGRVMRGNNEIGRLKKPRAKPKEKPKPGKENTPKPAPAPAETAMGPLDWPGTEGVLCTFVPSGENYGDIGDLAITNTTDQPVTVTVPPGLLLDSSNPGVQDLYVADVPTRTPSAGAKEINQPITIGAGETYTINDLPGFCPDFELKPPGEGLADIYTTRPPDEKTKTLLATIKAVKEFDVGTMKLQVFEKDQTREMLAQGALWTIDSRIDEVEGNEVTNQALSDRYWEAFESSGGPALAKMPPKQRKEAEDLVKEDLKKIVAATSFIAKKNIPG